MGLDITAYSKLTKLDALFNEDGEPVDPKTREPIGNYLRVYSNPDFPGRSEGLDDRAAYSYADADEALSTGYGGYNRWRERLAQLAGYELTPHKRFGTTEHLCSAACWNGAAGPFSELINFSDCEGTIGPVVSAKLLRDFIEFDESAKAVTDIPYFYEVYSRLKTGLELAADGGALDFH
jgi:hypothetical protein